MALPLINQSVALSEEVNNTHIRFPQQMYDAGLESGLHHVNHYTTSTPHPKRHSQLYHSCNRIVCTPFAQTI